VFAAIVKSSGIVEDVWEMTPMLKVAYVSEPPEWIEMRTIPVERPNHPVPIRTATVGVVGAGEPDIWAGSAAPDPQPPGDESR
jgi:hypothetical protein